MNKTTKTLAAALMAFTSLTTVAQASDADAIRLGIGIGAMIIGGIAKSVGGQDRGRHSSQPEQRHAPRRQASRPAPVATTDTASAGPTLPEVGPMPEARPDPSEVAAAEAQAATEQSAQAMPDMELRSTNPAPLAPTHLPETAQATAPASQSEKVELVDEKNRSWGFVTKAKAGEAWSIAGTGMKPSDAFKMAGLTPPPEAAPLPVAEAPKAPRELVDEDGTDWGYVSQETADKIAAAIRLGMKPSQAFAALSGLSDHKKKPPVAVAVTPKVAPPVIEPPAVAQAPKAPDPAPIVEAEKPVIDPSPTAAVAPATASEKPADAPKPAPKHLDL